MTRPIYLDYNATTPVDERVVEAMLPFFCERFGNASSNTHLYGWEADAAVRIARKQIADFLGTAPHNIIFTSGATESNNIVLMAISNALRYRGNHIITSSIEHKCVLNCCKFLENSGFEITYLPVDNLGYVNLIELELAIRPTTILISIMAANNEIGTLQPICRIGQIAKKYNVLFHTDAAQVVGKMRFKISELHVDFVSVSAHKLYGPKGVGLLYIKPLQMMQKHSFIHGGGQEKGIRSGTLNVPGIIGFAKACALAAENLDAEEQRLSEMKKHLYSRLLEKIPHIKLNGSLDKSLPGTLNIRIPGVNSTKLLSNLKNDFALSTGSACTSLNQEYSHVLKAIGCSEEEGKTSIRISLGRFTQFNQVDALADAIVKYHLLSNSENLSYASV